MAGLTITVKDDAVKAALKRLIDAGANLLPFYTDVKEVVLNSVRRNFEKGGRPKWLPLSPRTIERKGHSRPLIEKGILQNIVGKSTAEFARIGVQPSAKAYAAIQHFGGRAGRGRKVKIPARPYLVLQEKDKKEIVRLAEEHIRRAFNK